MGVYIEPVSDYDPKKLRAAIEHGIEELGVDVEKARRVVIKPNIVQSRAPETAVVTHPAVVEALVDALHGRGVDEISVAEAPAMGASPEEAFRTSGYAGLAKRKGVRLINLFETPRTKIHTGYGYENLPNVYDDADLPNYHCGYMLMPTVVVESDLYINVAKLKTHNRATVTLTMKNQWGLLSFKHRQMYHRVGLHEPIVQIARAVQPHLTVVDGIVGMEGNAPILGKPKRAGVLMVGQNMVETDAVGAMLMRHDPRAVIHLQRAVEVGLGSWETDVRGARVEDLAVDFQPAPQDVKRNHNLYLWRNHRACHLDDDAFRAAVKIAKRTPKYWMFFPKLAYYTFFKRMDIIRGRGSKMPEIKDGQKIIVSGECARELIENYEEVPRNVIHIPGCPPDPEEIIRAIIRM